MIVYSIFIRPFEKRTHYKITPGGGRVGGRAASTDTLSGAYLLQAWRDFNQTSHKCSPPWGGVSCTGTRSLPPRSRSQLKINVKLKHTLCPEHVFYMHGLIQMKPHTNVHHHKAECHPQDSGPYLQGQGHTWRLNWSTHFVWRISSTCTCMDGFKWSFTLMFTTMRRSLMCKIQFHTSNVKVTLGD